jgi:hypothetical protein
LGDALPPQLDQKGEINAWKEARTIDQATEDVRGPQEKRHEQDQGREDQQRAGEKELT